MLLFETLVLEFEAVDRFSTRTVSFSEVTALKDKVLDDTMELRALVVERLSLGALSQFAGTKSTEIFGCLGSDIAV